MWIWKNSDEIDWEEWDQKIVLNPDYRLEALSWYLEVVSDQWGAFFLSGKDIRIPVSYKKNWAMKTACRAPFTQQHRFIGSEVPDQAMIEKFMASLADQFNCGKYCLNYFIPDTQRRTNLVVDLEHYRLENEEMYSSHHKRRVKKSLSNHISIDFSVSKPEFLNWIDQFQKQNAAIEGLNRNALQKLSTELFSRQKGFVVAARNQKNEIISLCLLSDNGYRIVNLMSLSSIEGKKKIAMYGILHTVLQQFKNSHRVFDFEGSDLEGVKQFYQGFGPATEAYFEVSWNQHWFCTLKDLLKKWIY
ncbi:MAG: hypothetical protein IPM48_01625 [Saprospiraceae bacterium]|nr:hypothetical protein [Saprospiraceae bacterium]